MMLAILLIGSTIVNLILRLPTPSNSLAVRRTESPTRRENTSVVLFGPPIAWRVGTNDVPAFAVQNKIYFVVSLMSLSDSARFYTSRA